MDTPFMEFFARQAAEADLRVVRFEFPYMAQRRLGGPKRPDREDVLRQTWLGIKGAIDLDQVREHLGLLAAMLDSIGSALVPEPTRRKFWR